jgi:5-methylcytosine-specific restriction protein A
MAHSPPHPCAVPGCPLLVPTGGECPAHPRHRDRARETHRPNATERGYGRTWSAISAAWLRAHPRCVWCGRPATVTDHIVPKRFGGRDEPANYQALCRHCHALKTARETRR